MSQPRLSVVVPVYNEERTLRQIVSALTEHCGRLGEFIFVDDGSKDASLSILKEIARPEDTVLTKPNGGKGSAVRMGYAHAKGTYVIVQDADLEYTPSDIPRLLEYAEAHQVQALFGSRRLKKQKQFSHLSFFIGGTILTWVCNILYGTRLTDQPTCYKMVKGDLLKTLPLKENDFRFDPELTVMLARRGAFIAEQPVSYMPRTVEEGKKINWKDWFRWMWVFLSLRFAPASHFRKSA